MTGDFRSQPSIVEVLRELYATHPICIQAADRIEELEGALRMFCDRINTHGNWDDGCFYYGSTSASELQEPMRLADAALSHRSTKI